MLLFFQTAGILVSDGLLFNNLPEIIASALLLITGMILCTVLCKKNSPCHCSDKVNKNAYHQHAYTAMLISAAVCTACISCNRMHRQQHADTVPFPAQSGAMIIESVTQARYHQNLFVKTPSQAPSPGLKGTLAFYGTQKLNPGDKIKVSSGKLRMLSPDTVISPFEKSLIRMGYDYTARCGDKHLSVTARAGPETRYSVREHIRKTVRSLFTQPLAGLIEALYFGNKSTIDKKTLKAFKEAGVYHVLAASGLHVGIIAALPLLVLGLARINKRYILCLSLTCVYAYLFITDMPVSLMRASVMLSVLALQTLFYFHRNAVNTLFLSALIILAIFPYELFNLGFQLSFGATFGILAFYPQYGDALKKLNIPGKLKTLTALTLSAQLLVTPLLLCRMHEINCTGIVSNIIAIPLVSCILIMSMSACAAAPLSYSLAKFCAMATEQLYEKSFIIIKSIASWGGHFHVQDISPLLIIPFIVLLVPLIPQARQKRYAVTSVLCGYALLWFMLGPASARTIREVHVCRNSPDRFILYHNDNDLFLIGSIRSAETSRTIVKKINAQHYNTLTLYLTDPDYRNYFTFGTIIKKAVVSDCYISSDFALTKNFHDFCALLDRDNISLHISDLHCVKNTVPAVPNRDEAARGLADGMGLYRRCDTITTGDDSLDNISVTYFYGGSDNDI